jgi:transcriptional regulator with XRE-family HTH domain
MPTDRPPIGIKIKRARERLRLTQEDLAGRVGVSQKTIDNWEHDRSYPRSAIGALEAILGSLTQTPSEDETPREGSGFRADYPSWLGDDPGLKWIWDGHRRNLLSEQEARLAIAGVNAVRGQAETYRQEEPRRA